MGEGGSGNVAVVDLSGVAKDVVHSHGSLGSGCVGQHQLAGDITNSPEVGNRLTIHQHAHRIVNRHKASIQLNAQGIQV